MKNIRSYYIPDDKESQEIIEKFLELRWRERKSESQLAMQAIKEYVLNHSEGNDSYTLDFFTKNPESEATPALSRPKPAIIEFLLAIWNTKRRDTMGEYIRNWVQGWNEVEAMKNANG